MILRRVIAHVRKQEWTAIWIDLVIVVVGVFIGLQVSNWNEDRATARRGQVFTERLRSDLREESRLYEALIAYYGDVAANKRRTLDALTGREALSDEPLLIAAYRATQYRATVRLRSTFDELVSRGELGLVKDPALRDLARLVYSNPFIDYIVEGGRASEYRHWFRLNMPHDVQQALVERCGDRSDPSRRLTRLDYPCTTGLSESTIAAAVSLLRNDPEAIRELRLRSADLETQLNDLVTSSDAMRRDLRVLTEATL